MAVATRGSRGETFAGYTDLVVEACCNCGVLFAMPDALKEAALKDRGPHGRQFYCPNGHEQHYTGRTDAQRLADEREHSARLAAARDQAQASAEAQKRAAKRARNERDRDRRRVASGVCPCCKRSFKALRRHMASQHPGYAEDTVEA